VIDVVCGARPNFMKVDPVLRSLPPGLEYRLVHTGQHYDHAMSQAFFDDLGLPRPDVNLEVGSASITVQTAAVMQRYEEALPDPLPEMVVVVGDVNSTLACSLVAVRHGMPVAHVEAGLRSGDRGMPEEINRLLTDQLSDLLLITSPEARRNLRAEGRPEDAVVMVGNPMIDTLLRLIPRALAEHGDGPRQPFGLVTLHRPSNVDEPSRLAGILGALGAMDGISFLFPVHPRTSRNIQAWGMSGAVPPNVVLLEPMGYLEFTARESRASIVITDSGGVQEETTVLGVPCVTVRPNTERPVTVEMGTNILCPDPEGIPSAVAGQMARRPATPPAIPFWDGKAGPRIADAIGGFLQCRREA
jgi:UDP-N-acetylglucosamine 2-epimerase (non-hydrolysing)